MNSKIAFITLWLMISFASTNAVLFTPALPDLAQYFAINDYVAQYTVTFFLIGYALGQLVYGPLANRLGRKPALYMGIGLQIVSSLLCVLAGFFHQYLLVVLGRFLLALGSGVGLKMTFTLVNESFSPMIASKKISYLMLAFAISPALSIALGGFLTEKFGWMSCFYASAAYGVILFLLVTILPETKKHLDLDALRLNKLIKGYFLQFKNIPLVTGGILMGSCTTFIYAFAAVAPFLAINLFGMSSAIYGLANLLPALGLAIGSIASAQLSQKFALIKLITLGMTIASVGVLLMLIGVYLNWEILYFLFMPMLIIYLGLSFILASASTVAMAQVEDKANGSAVMNFINMSMATVVVLCLHFFAINRLLLPLLFGSLCLLMFIIKKGWAKADI